MLLICYSATRLLSRKREIKLSVSVSLIEYSAEHTSDVLTSSILIGLWWRLCVQCGGKNIRFVVMNNLLPSSVRYHEKYDLKGSTNKRRASRAERAKTSPTLKDLDFIANHPDGIMLEADTFAALVKTIERDCRVGPRHLSTIVYVVDIIFWNDEWYMGDFNFWLSLSLSETLSWTLKSGLRPNFNLTSLWVRT